MSFSQLEILLVSTLFTGGAVAKRRPVMGVFGVGDNALLVAPISIGERNLGDNSTLRFLVRRFGHAYLQDNHGLLFQKRIGIEEIRPEDSSQRI